MCVTKYNDTWSYKPNILKRILNPDPDTKKRISEGWRKHAFNQYVSDIIPLDRSLPDPRDSWCRGQGEVSGLPDTSVIITFHNEVIMVSSSFVNYQLSFDRPGQLC